jgi:PD-(D/E)XK nuclease superfamily
MTTIKLNPSLLDKYQDCPGCFARAWQERQERRSQWRKATNYNLALGLAAHEVLAHVNRHLLNGRAFPTTEKTLEQCFNPSHFSSKEQAVQGRYDVGPMIDQYHGYLAQHGLAVEAVEQWVTGNQHVTNEIVLVLNGRIDVILADTTGATISLDLKTRRVLVPEDLEPRLSTAAYRCLTQILRPHATTIKNSQLSLTTGIPVTVELTTATRQAAKERILQLASALAEDPSAIGPAFAPGEGCTDCTQGNDWEQATLSM